MSGKRKVTVPVGRSGTVLFLPKIEIHYIETTFAERPRSIPRSNLIRSIAPARSTVLPAFATADEEALPLRVPIFDQYGGAAPWPASRHHALRVRYAWWIVVEANWRAWTE